MGVVKFVTDEHGASLVEYVLLLALVAMLAVTGIRTYGIAVTNRMNGNQNSVATAIN